MSNDVAIRVEGLSKKFCKNLRRTMRYGLCDIGKAALGIRPDADRLRKDEFWALKDVSFEVKRGECLGIIGPNGAGKSTLFKILAGIMAPTKGRVEIHGRLSSLIEIGTGFHPMLTGRENIYINGAILGMTKKEIDAKFDEIVDFAGIGDFIDTPVKFYSSGMYVRLGFAVAAHLNPELLLVDEVLAVGDASFKRKCLQYMDSLRNGGVCFLLVSHSMQTIAAIADICIMLNHGRVIAHGIPAKVVAEYELMMQPSGEYTRGTVNTTQDGALELIHESPGFQSGDVLIDAVWLEDEMGSVSREFESTEIVTVCFTFECLRSQEISEGFLYLNFINELGIGCLGATIPFGESGLPKVLPKRGVIKVCFSPIQLSTSTYHVSLHLFDRNFSLPYAGGYYGEFRVRHCFSCPEPGFRSPACYSPVVCTYEKHNSRGVNRSAPN